MEDLGYAAGHDSQGRSRYRRSVVSAFDQEYVCSNRNKIDSITG